MQLGFNTNFRYRDVVFHVQTEDSGRANPHVITHLFHGGNIIASVKRDYADLLAEADLEAAVRKLMESQHKAMLKQLSRGEFDRAIGERLGPEVFRVDAEAGAAAVATLVEDAGDGTDAARPAAARGGRAGLRLPGDSETGSSATGSTDRTPGLSRRGARASAERTVLTPERRETTSGLARVFGDRVVSEKPLDEVVLDYLVENARKRKRPPK